MQRHLLNVIQWDEIRNNISVFPPLLKIVEPFIHHPIDILSGHRFSLSHSLLPEPRLEQTRKLFYCPLRVVHHFRIKSLHAPVP